MSITVITAQNTVGVINCSDFYKEATNAVVKDGHLEVYRPDGRGGWESLGQYAPGSWHSWSLDQHSARSYP